MTDTLAALKAEWRIHLTHEGGMTTISAVGTREEVERRAVRYIGKPASWNVNKNPHEPNMWDCYRTFRIEPIQ